MEKVTLVHPALPGREEHVKPKVAAVMARSGWVVKKESARQKKASDVSPTDGDQVPQLESDGDKDKE